MFSTGKKNQEKKEAFSVKYMSHSNAHSLIIQMVSLSSLSEYVNAGIEAVKIAEESGMHQASQVNATSKETVITPTTNLAINNKHERYEQAGLYLYATETAVSNNVAHSNDTLLPNAEQNVDNTGFTTDERPHSIQTDENLDNIEQNTYSHQNVANLDPPSYEESQNEQEFKNIPHSVQSKCSNEDETTTSTESDDSDSVSADEKTSDSEFDEKMADESVEIRTELSSVVPPTSISLEITASTAYETNTALPDTINGESSEMLPNESFNHHDNEGATTTNLDHNEECEKNEHIDDRQAIEVKSAHDQTVSQSNDRFIKPITFETAATMDDVSDTELESYLQELEDLEENSIGMKTKMECVKSANGSIKSDDIEPYGSDALYNVDQTIGNVSELQQIATKADDRNADSFSQASTVEFGEVNATESSEQIPNVHLDQNIEVAAGVDTVLDEQAPERVQVLQRDREQVDEPITSEITEIQPVEPTDVTTNVHTENASELDESARDRELSSDLENTTECSECEHDPHVSSSSTPKRPNSLNLQNCNSTHVESQPNNSNSNLNFSSDDNAGSTPAACGQFLSSSISSDDSNIVGDNNQLMVRVRHLHLFCFYLSL